MNIHIMIAAVAFCGIHTKLSAERVKIDGIKSTIYTHDAVDIATLSDLQRLSLDGSPRTLQTIEFEVLVYQEAARSPSLMLDDTATEKGLEKLLKDNNLTKKQLEDIFKSSGYTYQEGREQFRRMSTINQMLDHRIRSRLLVPEKDVKAYYNEHPVYEDASYLIQRAFVPFNRSVSIEKLQQQVEVFAKGQPTSLTIEWSPVFWVQEDELAQEKRFITLLDVGQISEPYRIDGGFELFRLVQKKERRLKPLELRYTEIANILRKPRYDKLFDEYKNQLFDAASIIRFDD